MTSHDAPPTVVESIPRVRPVRKHGTDVIDAAMRHVLDRRPDDVTTGVVWYDARVGNIIFGDDQRVAAIVDWGVRRSVLRNSTSRGG